MSDKNYNTVDTTAPKYIKSAVDLVTVLLEMAKFDLSVIVQYPLETPGSGEEPETEHMGAHEAIAALVAGGLIVLDTHTSHCQCEPSCGHANFRVLCTGSLASDDYNPLSNEPTDVGQTVVLVMPTLEGIPTVAKIRNMH